MDGIHPQTVHKLLTFLFPSPLLLEKSHVEKEKLSEIISSLHLWNDLPDFNLRPCHQLDYATSGCLLVARSRKAAAFAGKSFQDRLVEKIYIAVVIGHVDFTSNDVPTQNEDDEWVPKTSAPVHISREHFDLNWGLVENDGNTLNKEYKYRKHKKQAASGFKVDGFLPVYAVFAKWQSAITKYYNKKEAIRCITNDNRDNLPNYKDEIVTIQGGGACQIAVPRFACEQLERQLATSTKWKNLKKQPGMDHIVHEFEQLCSKYNASLLEEDGTIAAPPLSRKEKRKWNHVKNYNKTRTESRDTSTPASNVYGDLPTIFRIAGEDDDESCYINASIADLKPDFRMLIHPDAMKQHKDANYRDFYSITSKSTEGLDFKPALTKCTVLWRGFWNCLEDNNGFTKRIAVTKVLLQPRTGRRHQLRLHMAALGHPILGDFTYEYNPFSAQAETRKTSRLHSERMCLHAHRLNLPLLVGAGSDTNYDTNTLTFTAKDPFQVVHDEHGNNESLLIMSTQQYYKYL